MAVAPDGSPVEFYLRFPPGNAPKIVGRAVQPGSEILELGCGAGRVTHALLALGYYVVAVDNSEAMLRHVRGAEKVLASIETLDLGRRFPAVLLASHFVNVPDASLRAAFLAACRRHVAADGVVLIERLDPLADWPSLAGNRNEAGGGSAELRDVRLRDRLLSATTEYRVGEKVWHQPWTARLLDDEELAVELEKADLRLSRILDERGLWIEALPA